jgi:flagellar motility protein MotE (MotC chaperone)
MLKCLKSVLAFKSSSCSSIAITRNIRRECEPERESKRRLQEHKHIQPTHYICSSCNCSKETAAIRKNLGDMRHEMRQQAEDSEKSIATLKERISRAEDTHRRENERILSALQDKPLSDSAKGLTHSLRDSEKNFHRLPPQNQTQPPTAPRVKNSHP